jgi:hypothetical protein
MLHINTVGKEPESAVADMKVVYAGSGELHGFGSNQK